MPVSQKQNNGTRIVGRLFRTMLPIQALAIGLPAVNSLIDSIIVGQSEGTNALAALGFYGPMSLCISAIGSMLSVGSQMKCGEGIGRGDTGSIKRYFNTTLMLCVLILLPFALAFQFIPGVLAGLLGADGEIAELTAEYLRGMAPGLIFIALQGTLLPFLQLERKDKVCTAIVLLILAVNIAGDLVCALVLHWGVYGFGLSTSLSNLLAALVAFPYLLKHSGLFKFSPKFISGHVVREICIAGAPSALNPFCTMGRNLFINRYLYMAGGAVAMSAMSIASSVTTAFGCMIESGYSGTARMIASVLVGERDTSSLRKFPKVMAQKAWYLYVSAYAIVFIFTKPLALLFGADTTQIDVYVRIIRIFNLWYITNIIKAAPVCIYEALGNLKLSCIMTVYSNFLVPSALVVLFGKQFGIYYIASITVLGELFTILAYAVIFTVKAHRLPRSVFELCYIPHTISAPRENRIKAEIRTPQEAVNLSERAMAFCREKQLSERRAYYCGLCLEEMMMSTIEHNFRGKDDVIDVRIIYEDGHIRILLRDDCAPFDPVKWLELCDNSDPMRSVGIRMVQKLSEEMNYVNSLGWNVLTIIL